MKKYSEFASKLEVPRNRRRLYLTADHPFLYFITQKECVLNESQTAHTPKKLLFVGTFC